MGERDPRLGTFAMYSREGVEMIGLRAAAERTIAHLEWRIKQTKQGGSDMRDEIVRLRRVANMAAIAEREQ